MKNLSLSSRLKTLATLIGQKDILADIGTDHGQLITWLALHDKINYGFACDVKEGPLKACEKTISHFAMENKISTVLTNGLQGLEHKNITAYVIAGMGGELIAEIILDSPWSHNVNTCFYLQPMTRDYQLREQLYKNGFYINREIPITCGKYTYTCMEVFYSGEKSSLSFFQAWTGEIWEQENKYANEYLLERYQQLSNMAPYFSGKEEYAMLLETMKERLNICDN